MTQTRTSVTTAACSSLTLHHCSDTKTPTPQHLLFPLPQTRPYVSLHRRQDRVRVRRTPRPEHQAQQRPTEGAPEAAVPPGTAALRSDGEAQSGPQQRGRAARSRTRTAPVPRQRSAPRTAPLPLPLPPPRTFPDELLAVRLVARAVAAPPEPRDGGVEAAAAVRVQRGGGGGSWGGGRGPAGQQSPRGPSAERQVRAGRRHGTGRVAALVAEAAAALAVPPRVRLVPGVGADGHGQQRQGGGGQEQPRAAQRLSRGRHLTAPGAAGAGTSSAARPGASPAAPPRKGIGAGAPRWRRRGSVRASRAARARPSGSFRRPAWALRLTSPHSGARGRARGATGNGP